jgi:hypothetical protein
MVGYGNEVSEFTGSCIEYIRSDKARYSLQSRSYQQKKALVKRFTRKKKTTDTSRILNEVNIDYDTLMLVLADLQNEGDLRNI